MSRSDRDTAQRLGGTWATTTNAGRLAVRARERRGRLADAELAEALDRATRVFVRRQMTWLRDE